MRRVLIAGGGTGGHFYPGLVLAQTLRARGWRPLTLVRRNDPALPLLEAESLASCEVDLRGLPRSLSPALAAFAFQLARSLGLVGRIVKDFQPDVVVGMGGYLTFPAVLAAARRRAPRAVHESNVRLGLANALSLKLGASLFRGLPGAGGTLTGTPIRPALWTPGPAAAARRELGLEPGKKTILVFGGSQGARTLNEQLPALLSAFTNVQVLHLAGPKGAARYAGKAVVLPYLEKMETAYAAADLVICRAGASTLAELIAQRKPAVLVPFPHAAANHQEENAALLESAGAARLVREADLKNELVPAVEQLLLSAPPDYSRLGLPAASQTAEKLADAVEALAGST